MATRITKSQLRNIINEAVTDTISKIKGSSILNESFSSSKISKFVSIYGINPEEVQINIGFTRAGISVLSYLTDDDILWAKALSTRKAYKFINDMKRKGKTVSYIQGKYDRFGGDTEPTRDIHDRWNEHIERICYNDDRTMLVFAIRPESISRLHDIYVNMRKR